MHCSGTHRLHPPRAPLCIGRGVEGFNVSDVQWLADVNISPNGDGLPGISEAKHLVGALLTYGLIAAFAGVALSAISWAVGAHSSNPTLASRGRSGLLVCAVVALVIGGADTYINFFAHAGQSL